MSFPNSLDKRGGQSSFPQRSSWAISSVLETIYERFEVRKFGSSGSGDGQFYGPHGIFVDNSGNIYVTDINNRVQKFTLIPNNLR